ncbi:hypothetical protein RB25_09670 [Herbaspirillum rubrisubalbicans]|uniref:hypothetical protein n=1 Tax=Herbaspirillum rubrisubalbicans TaxID=80842 RepID=UPI000DC44DAA|nr:hypothetical protein [Herbaspirillum rubrisubalbicans]RAN48603.1 hypothetical protein RB25_09670 [Herbaspirillum rubrisubalbicans]
MTYRQLKYIHATCLDLFSIPCHSKLIMHQKDRKSHRYQQCELTRAGSSMVEVYCRDFACSRFRFEVDLAASAIKFPDDVKDYHWNEIMLDLLFEMVLDMLLEESEFDCIFTKTIST